MNERLTWIGDEDIGYIADAGDVVYIVDRKRADSSHSYTAMVYRVDKKDCPILWREAFACPRRDLVIRLMHAGLYVSYRTVMDTTKEGKAFARRHNKMRHEPMVKEPIRGPVVRV